jgi:putative peptidoglycan lipid II flippase
MSDRLAKSAGTIGAAVMTSRLFGLIRDQVMAYLFGTSTSQDAFAIASRVPNLVRDLFAEGAMSAAFVPTFTRYLQREGKEAAFRLGNLVLNALLVVTLVLVVVGIIFARPILMLLPEEFQGAGGSDRLTLTVQLAQVIMPFLTLVAIAVALGGMLNAMRHFFIPALSPAIFNVGVLFSAAAFYPLCISQGWDPIFAIAIGTLIGGIGQIVIQIPLLRREGFRYQPILDFKDPGVREILMLVGPGTLGLAAAQVNVAVSTYLAAGEGQGAVSALSFAFRLMYLPIGLFGVSVATAALPDISRYAASSDHDGMRRTISSSLRMMLMLSVPASIGLMILAHPIVEFIFQRGEFGIDSTRDTAMALLCYAPGLIGYSAVKIASPTFYAMHEPRTPVLVSIGSIAINLVISLLLIGPMGFPGLALGTGIAALFNAGMLMWLLSSRIGGLEGSRVLQAFLKILVASIVMGAAALVAEAWLDAYLPDFTGWATWLPATLARTLRAGLRVTGGIGAGLIMLAAVASLLRLHEFTTVSARVLGRLRR